MRGAGAGAGRSEVKRREEKMSYGTRMVGSL